MEKKWKKVANHLPKAGEMVYVFSSTLDIDIAIEAIVTKSPFGDDDNLYWHFIHPITKNMMWSCLMADDRWMPCELIKSLNKDSKEILGAAMSKSTPRKQEFHFGPNENDM